MKKGFTLIELLIVLALSSIVLASVFRSFLTMQKVYETQDQVAEMNQNARVAMERIARDIRNIVNVNAGTLVSSGIQILSNRDIYNDTPTQNVVDLLRIVVYTTDSTDSSKRVTGSASGTAIPVDSTTGFAANDYAVITDRNFTEVFRVSGTSSSQFTTSQNLSRTYAANSEVYKVNYLDYGIKPIDNCDDCCNCPVLKRRKDGGDAMTLAENIEDLNFRFIDTNGNEILSPLTNTVKITLIAKTRKQDASYGYRKRTLTSYAKMRNM